MSARRSKLIVAAVIVFAAVLAAWLIATSTPPVRVRVVELTTDSHGLSAPPIGRQRAYAIIEVTNVSSRPVIYRSPLAFMSGRPQFARNIVSYQSASGWSPHPVYRLG